jgi:hypothetical protein
MSKSKAEAGQRISSLLESLNTEDFNRRQIVIDDMRDKADETEREYPRNLYRSIANVIEKADDKLITFTYKKIDNRIFKLD